MDTVGRIVLSLFSELEQIALILKLMSSVFLRHFSAVEKKRQHRVCCLLFILETVHMRRNLSAAMPIHLRLCT